MLEVTATASEFLLCGRYITEPEAGPSSLDKL